MREFTHPSGDAVRKARKELEYTQNQVADKINFNVRTIINIENRKGNPNGSVISSHTGA